MRNLWFVLVALLLVPASYAKTARELRDDCMAARRINKAIEKQASFRVERSEGEQAIFCYA